jgi:hypothetical protein
VAVEHKESFVAGAVNSFHGTAVAAAVGGGGSGELFEENIAPVLDLG